MATEELLSSAYELHAIKARETYIESRTPLLDTSDWAASLRFARKEISQTLRATKYLTDITGALRQSGKHSLVLRYLIAPPISQDQLELVCSGFSKGREKSGTAYDEARAAAFASTFDARRSRVITKWLDQGRLPYKRDIHRLLWSVAPMIAQQQFQTISRNTTAARQEYAVIKLLTDMGWTREPATLLDLRASLPSKHFQHKTRYSTGNNTSQEVDLAIGLGKTVVLAMECKVSNDQTNSIKRVNDVLKKATAWRHHWGSFVKTAALLQGVIAPKDVGRLIDADIKVFWSHNLAEFKAWLEAETS